MRLVFGNRRSGKTTYLIKLAAENDGLIITSNAQNIRHIMKMARELGLNIREPMTAYDYVNLKGSFYKQRQCVPILVDDADEILRMLLGAQSIDTITGCFSEIRKVNK